jgi:formylglycine-generating enzyme required for sulfatase activity
MRKFTAIAFWFPLFVAANCVLQIQPAFGQTPATVKLQITNGVSRLSVSGAASNACTIQFATNLAGVNPWHYLANFQATSSPALFSDTNSLFPSRFYRAFTQLLPTNVVPATNMIWISPGTFTMGSPTNEALRGSDEIQHVVTLSRGFFMAKFPVKQADYLALTSTNPSFFSTNHGYAQNLNLPVEEVSWNDATNYCALLTQHEITGGRISSGWAYRLPTESEWEYACRAGTMTAFYYGSALRSGMANFDGQIEYDAKLGAINNPSGIFLDQPTGVGSYEANAWGLFDMCGNVCEWCQDWYGNYPAGPVTDPQGPATGSARVVRNNSYFAYAQFCRSAERFISNPTNTFGNVGFRVVLAPSP